MTRLILSLCSSNEHKLFIFCFNVTKYSHTPSVLRARCFSGRASDSEARGPGFEPKTAV